MNKLNASKQDMVMLVRTLYKYEKAPTVGGGQTREIATTRQQTHNTAQPPVTLGLVCRSLSPPSRFAVVSLNV